MVYNKTLNDCEKVSNSCKICIVLFVVAIINHLHQQCVDLFLLVPKKDNAVTSINSNTEKVIYQGSGKPGTPAKSNNFCDTQGKPVKLRGFMFCLEVFVGFYQKPNMLPRVTNFVLIVDYQPQNLCCGK